MAEQRPTVEGDRLAYFDGSPYVYVIPQYKLMYVSLAKNACTTLKWAMAELAGEDLDGFRPALRAYVSDDQGVHIRVRFKKALQVDQLDPAVRAEIDPGNGWFIFSVVRDPRARVFSGWQDKFLLQDPQFQRFRNRPWYPQIPADADEIIAGFARFVDALASEPELLLNTDRHFAPQAEQLDLEHVPYSRIYQIEQVAQLQLDLSEHVQRLGWSGPVTFRNINQTPLRPIGAAFAGGVREKIEALYAADFAAFGQHWDFAKVQNTPAWAPSAIREVQVRGELGHRLEDLRRIGLRLRDRLAEAEARAARLEAELAAARGEASWEQNGTTVEQQSLP